MIKILKYCFLFFGIVSAHAQTTVVSDSIVPLTTDSFSQIQVGDYDPLSPSKAAFYSAIFPGMGQAYNKKYWKVPIVWGALGTSTYFYVTNKNYYDQSREAYKLLKLGFPVPEDNDFYDLVYNSSDPESRLESAQEYYKRNADLSLLITIGIYALQIIEASVNAHLMQFNMDSDISFVPEVNFDPITGQSYAGMSFKYKFK